jgi:hypothetical protein
MKSRYVIWLCYRKKIKCGKRDYCRQGHLLLNLGSIDQGKQVVHNCGKRRGHFNSVKYKGDNTFFSLMGKKKVTHG